MWAPDGVAESRPGQVSVGEIQFPAIIYTGSITSYVDIGGNIWRATVTCPAITLRHNGPITQGTAPVVTFLAADTPAAVLVSGPVDLTVNATRVYTFTSAVPGGGGGPSLVNQFQYLVLSFQMPLLVQQLNMRGLRPVVYVTTTFIEANTFGANTQWFGYILVFKDMSRIHMQSDGSFPTGALYRESDGKGTTPGRLSTVVAIPDFDTIYVTYNHVIYDAGIDIPHSTEIQPATVNTDPELVGPRYTSTEGTLITPPLSVDVIPQLSSPPRAEIIFYFKGLVFALKDRDRPYDVQWSAPVILTGRNLVWPLISYERMDDEFGEPPMAISSLHEQPVVFKRRSISILVPDVDATTGLAQFALIRVSTGTGTEAQHGIVEVRGQLYFPADDGFYAFNGAPVVSKLSQAIDQFYKRIPRGAKQRAVGANWASKHCVLWSFPATSGSTTALGVGYIIVYDYSPGGGWWIWELAGTTTLTVAIDSSGKQGLILADSTGEITRLDETYAGVAASILTHRLGEPSFTTQAQREVWVEQTTDMPAVGVEIRSDDDANQEAATKAITYRDSTDIQWGAVRWGQSTYVANKRRSRHADAVLQGKHFQLRIFAAAAAVCNKAWKLVRAAITEKPLRHP